MSLPIFVDQCVPQEMSDALRSKQHDVILLREELPIRSPDPAVIAKAQELDSILFSLNGDFSDIVIYPPANHSGIIAVQLHNHPEIIPQLMDSLLSLESCSSLKSIAFASAVRQCCWRNGMSSSNAKVKNVTVNRETLTVELVDGRVVSVPLTWYPTLVQATAKQLKQWKPCGAGSGIYCPSLDYHLSVEGLLRGAREAEGVTRRMLANV